MAHACIVHWRSHCIEEDEESEEQWRYECLTKFFSSLTHWFPVAHIKHTLREEYGIEIDHQENVIQVLLFGLDLP